MMFKALLLIAIAGAAEAQTIQPWVDLSGCWKTIEGDNPEYAAADFDDSAWKVVTLPITLPDFRDQARYFWLRRTFTAPAGLPQDGLAITLGAFSETYELFVNGVKVGGAGGFTRATTQLARPRTFDLPSWEGERVSIAIRVWLHAFPGSIQWRRVIDTGPYVITGVSNAPRQEASHSIQARRLRSESSLIQTAAVFALSLILLLLYANQRSRTELLWLGIFGIVTAYRLYAPLASMRLDATPWNWFVPLGVIQNALLIEYILATFDLPGRPWFRIPAWLAMAFYLANSESTSPKMWSGTLLTVGIAGLLTWAMFRKGSRRTGHWPLLCGLWIVWLYEGGLNISAFRPLFLLLDPIFSQLFFNVDVLFLLLNVLVLTRRSVADRLERQRLTGEMEAARAVQQLLISKAEGAGVDYIYEPAQEVGGDFYYRWDDGEGGFMLAAGDVSGKGLKAAMLVSMVVGALTRERSTSPAAVLSGLNQALCGHTGGGFVTCCCARFAADGSVRMANAGHPNPYADGREVELSAGLPLGVAELAEYADVPVAGSSFTFVSDGVVEAANPAGELFGFERTREISGKSARAIAGAAQAWGQNDDITVVTVRRAAA